MDLHTLHVSGSVLFSTTDYDDFLSRCVTLYNEESDETWEDYSDPSELPAIFEKHAYHYLVIAANRLIKINTNNDLVNLYFKLQRYNPTINFDNGTTLMLACNRLLNYYNTESLKYLNDTTNEVSLLTEIVGNDGIEQLSFHKSFRDTYGVSIY